MSDDPKPELSVKQTDHPHVYYDRFKYDDWRVLASFGAKGFYHDMPKSEDPPPSVVVYQHRRTGELRVDIYDVEKIETTYTNAGTNDPRAKWFRDVILNRGNDWHRARVRLLSPPNARGGSMDIHS